MLGAACQICPAQSGGACAHGRHSRACTAVCSHGGSTAGSGHTPCIAGSGPRAMRRAPSPPCATPAHTAWPHLRPVLTAQGLGDGWSIDYARQNGGQHSDAAVAAAERCASAGQGASDCAQQPTHPSASRHTCVVHAGCAARNMGGHHVHPCHGMRHMRASPAACCTQELIPCGGGAEGIAWPLRMTRGTLRARQPAGTAAALQATRASGSGAGPRVPAHHAHQPTRAINLSLFIQYTRLQGHWRLDGARRQQLLGSRPARRNLVAIPTTLLPVPHTPAPWQGPSLRGPPFSRAICAWLGRCSIDERTVIRFCLFNNKHICACGIHLRWLTG